MDRGGMPGWVVFDFGTFKKVESVGVVGVDGSCAWGLSTSLAIAEGGLLLALDEASPFFPMVVVEEEE